MRLFVALPVETDTARDIFQQLSPFRDTPGLKLIPPEGMHITLRFLGDVDGPKYRALIKMLKAFNPPVLPSKAEFSTIGRFPSSGRPSVLIAPIVRGSFEIENLYNALSVCLLPFFPKEKRNFSPHITLARVKDYTDIGILSQIMGISFKGSIPIERIILYKSELTSRGAVYTELAEIPLKTE